jgi:hypothetical protein
MKESYVFRCCLGSACRSKGGFFSDGAGCVVGGTETWDGGRGREGEGGCRGWCRRGTCGFNGGGQGGTVVFGGREERDAAGVPMRVLGSALGGGLDCGGGVRWGFLGGQVIFRRGSCLAGVGRGGGVFAFVCAGVLIQHGSYWTNVYHLG